ncbi:MAG: hydroxymethylglutaryl-CoA reductase, degradative [Candidatus Bathyarchaeota archaeon]|nr:hydroxymethylglutaryl-CoA reductase, degradative [Candidatus Bathyarchaeota archaeon]MDH5688210.1 hydroxymethylglutaryl-CoA reductase, degradative [Candidatus Bathyarchaeota archaeon]
MTSRIPGFYKLSFKERLNYLKEFARLSEEEVNLLSSSGAMELDLADRMIENVVGVMTIPFGIATGFLVNDKEYLVPMATEMRGIISMATKGAEWTRTTGGFKASSTGSTMIGQIQLVKVEDPGLARQRILATKEKILQKANTQSRTRKAIDVEVRSLRTPLAAMLVVELLVNVKDSMGANIVDSMCEAVAPLIESLTGGKTNVKIVSNLATKRLVHVETIVSKDSVGGPEIVDRIAEASAFAESDPFRAATHNKGIMNGVSAVLLATSNDTRAVEAGAHAYAAMTGQYRPLSTWRKNKEGNLLGNLTMPMAVGIIGGAISTHPTAKIALKILGVKTTTELGEIAASAGLAYNSVALQALVTQGIRSVYKPE